MKIIGISYSEGSMDKNKGCEKASEAIVNELRRLRKEFGFELIKINNKNSDDLNKISHGDIYLGGDHSITYNTFSNFTNDFKNPGILVFDAHPDCYPSDDIKFIGHEDWLYFLINNGIIRKENVILVGIRAIDPKEKAFLDKNNIKNYSMKVLYNNIEEICDSVMEDCRKFDGLYLSIDIDVLDPAFAPGTGYLEPGGMSSSDLIYFISRLKLLKNLKCVDLVEVNPDKDVNNLTVKLGSKIISEFLR